jgi:hypothetical protein
MTPLEDPSYVPRHPPIDGTIPGVLVRWGARSQLRWFARYGTQLTYGVSKIWEDYHVTSVEHPGVCCVPCGTEGEWWDGPECCCQALSKE